MHHLLIYLNAIKSALPSRPYFFIISIKLKCKIISKETNLLQNPKATYIYYGFITKSIYTQYNQSISLKAKKKKISSDVFMNFANFEFKSQRIFWSPTFFWYNNLRVAWKFGQLNIVGVILIWGNEIARNFGQYYHRQWKNDHEAHEK